MMQQEMNRVIANVVLNSCQAMAERAEREQGYRPQITLRYPPRDRHSRYILIRDNGTGIAPEVMDRILQSILHHPAGQPVRRIGTQHLPRHRAGPWRNPVGGFGAGTFHRACRVATCVSPWGTRVAGIYQTVATLPVSPGAATVGSDFLEPARLQEAFKQLTEVYSLARLRVNFFRPVQRLTGRSGHVCQDSPTPHEGRPLPKDAQQRGTLTNSTDVAGQALPIAQPTMAKPSNRCRDCWPGS